MSSPEQFVGARLNLARNLRVWTCRHLAEQVAVSGAYISQLERDERRPSFEVLEAFGCTLGFRPDFFCRRLLDEFSEEDCHFRKLSRTSAKQKGRALARGTLLTELMAQVENFVPLPNINVPEFVGRRTIDEIEKAAQRCRSAWGIPPGAPIRRVTRVAEHAGVFVVRLDERSKDVDAFSRWGSRPVIVLNSARGSSSRDRLNLAHELGHLVLHRRGGPDHKQKETDAFRFGQALLFPQRPFTRQFWSAVQAGVEGLRLLKREWGLSIAALIYRAKDLGLIDAAEYRRLNRARGIRGWVTSEPDEPPAEEPEMLLKALEATNEAPSALAHQLDWTLETLSRVTGFDFEPEGVVPLPAASV